MTGIQGRLLDLSQGVRSCPGAVVTRALRGCKPVREARGRVWPSVGPASSLLASAALGFGSVTLVSVPALCLLSSYKDTCRIQGHRIIYCRRL